MCHNSFSNILSSKMGRLFGLIIAIFLISHQLQPCVGFDVISVAASAIKFGKSVYDITNRLFKDEISAEDFATSIENLNQQIQDDMTHIIETLKDLPTIIRLEIKKETLEGHFAIIGQVFEEASQIKREVDDGVVHRNNSKYQRFALKDKDIDHSLYEIRRILTDSRTKFVLKQNFTETSKKFDNVCKTGMSHLQLLDSLLGNLKLATIQYYLSKKFMYEFLELTGEDNSNAKQTLLKNVNLDYSSAVRKFKDIMSTASIELWKCDPLGGYNDAVRYTKQTNTDFTELRVFSKYIFNEDNFVPYAGQCLDKKCNAITKLTCQKHNRRLCNEVRACPGNLVGCQQYTHVYPNVGIDVCKNKDKDAYHRYLSVVSKDEPGEKFQCRDGKKRTLYSIPFGYFEILSSCEYCDCLCEENEYFVEARLLTSDVNSNKVITGARLVVEDKVLRLQIQQALLVANGLVDKATLEWIPLTRITDKENLDKISFDEFKKFALSSVINTDGRVVISLSLSTSLEYKIVNLHLGFTEFDFATGALNDNFFKMSFTLSSDPTQQYNMTKRDASTKSNKENKPDSTDDQFVELTITDLAKDGGQSVVPFIDTQSVTANGPLSGASLYVRGQPGFGGFLAIKLYTFDMRKYVDDQSDV